MSIVIIDDDLPGNVMNLISLKSHRITGNHYVQLTLDKNKRKQYLPYKDLNSPESSRNRNIIVKHPLRKMEAESIQFYIMFLHNTSYINRVLLHTT